MKIEKKKWLVLVLILSLVGIVTLLKPPVFYLNDDVTMRSILSGTYTGTPDGHAVYMQYPLTGLLALSYKLCGSLPWLELCFTAFLVAGMVCVAWQFKRPVIGVLASVAVYMPFYLYMHYTLVAALMAATALFLLVQGKCPKRSLLFVAAAYMIRSQVGLLCLPFVLCALVWRVAVSPKEEWKKNIIGALKWLGCLAGGLLLIAGIHHVGYSAPEWKSYLAYNDSRTLLYDYTDFLSTDKYEKEYASFVMTGEEYVVLSSYNTMLDAGIDGEKMEQVAEAVSAGMQQETGLGQQWKDCIKKYYIQIRYNDVPYNYVWLGAYVILAVSLFLGKRWMLLGIMVLLGAGRSVVWMYLIGQGRFPERVSLSLYLLELMLLLGMGMYMAGQTKALKGKLEQIASWVLLAALLLACGYEWQVTSEKLEQRAQIQAGWDTLKAYCEEDADRLYLVDVFSAVEYADALYAGDAENLMLMGGWMSASPLAEEVFAGLGAGDAAEALCNNNKVSLIVESGKDMLWLEEYMQGRFGECELKAVKDITWRDGEGFTEYVIQVAGQ